MKTEFGQQMARLRKKSHESDKDGYLTQERFAELVGEKLSGNISKDGTGGNGYPDAKTVSNWERRGTVPDGRALPNGDLQLLLAAIIQVFFGCGGIKSAEDAASFLGLAGLALSSEHMEVIFGSDWRKQVLPLTDAQTYEEQPPYQQPYQLLAPVPDFVGRENEINALVENLQVLKTTGVTAAIRAATTPTINNVLGMGGTGKTQLARVVGERLREVFPQHHQIALDLQGSRETPLPAIEALQMVIRLFHEDARLSDNQSELEARYRHVLAGKRVLIVADDARNASQITPLLPPAGCALLITSRFRFEMPGMKTIDLDVLPVEQSVELLQQLNPKLTDSQAKIITSLCGGLPLALRAVAGITTRTKRSTDEYIDVLRDERERIYRSSDKVSGLDVEASLSASYRCLPTEEQLTLNMLGVFTASFDRQAAEQIVMSNSSVIDVLDTLIDTHLIDYIDEQKRYSLHELVRVFALAHLREDHALEWASHLRHSHHYIAIAKQANDLYEEGDEEARKGLILFDKERANIDASRRWLQSHAGDKEVDRALVDDADATKAIGEPRYRIRDERKPQLEQALDAARRLEDEAAEARFLGNLGTIYYDLQDNDKAFEYIEKSISLHRKAGRIVKQVGLMYMLGMIGIDIPSERVKGYQILASASEEIEQFLATSEGRNQDNDEEMTGLKANILELEGQRLFLSGEFSQARTYFEKALQINRDREHPYAVSSSLYQLGDIALAMGAPNQALQYGRDAQKQAENAGILSYESCALRVIGEAYVALGDFTLADTCLREARRIFHESESQSDYDNMFLSLAEVEYIVYSDNLEDKQNCHKLLEKADELAQQNEALCLLQRVAKCRNQLAQRE